MQIALSDLLARENPDAIVVVLPDGKVSEWTAAAEQIFGHPAAQAIGQPLAALIAPAGQADAIAQSLAQARSEGLAVEESVRRRRDGSHVYVSVSTKAIFDPQGSLQCYLCTMKDVTHLKVLRDAKLVEARYRNLLEFVPDAIVIVNASGRIVFANTQAERVFGYRHRELLGQPVEHLMPPR
jgi:PAS domain S-box-containing protein